MNSIVKAYTKIFNLGATSELSFSEKLKLNICNQSSAIAITLNILHLFIILIQPSSPYELMITISWLIIFSTSLLLNYLHKYVLANNLIIIASALMVGIIHYLFGPLVRMEPVYLTIIIIGLFIIKRSYVKYVVAGIVAIYSINTLIRLQEVAPFESYIVDKAAYEYFAFSIILSASLINKVIQENYNYNKILNVQNIKMQTQNEELKRFNYIISHDLKEPIRSMVGLTGLLAKKNQGEYSDITNEIVTLGRRLNNMVDDIVKFQELDKMNFKVEKILLSELVENVKASLSKPLQGRQAEINISGVDEINSSKTCVYLIMKNLIENAIKYNNNQPIVNIHCVKNPKCYSITVSDNGIGIPKIYHEEIFVMFKRLNQLKGTKGTGLGLSISKKLAQKYGATLEIVDPSKSERTTFCLTLPFQCANN